MKSTFQRVVCVLSGVAVCIASGFILSGCKDSPQKHAEMPPPLVKVTTVQAADIPLTGNFVGQAVGSLAVQVRAQVGGILKKRNYKEGDYVRQGQVLFEIDPDTYQAALEQAKAKQSQAAAALDRAKREWDRIQPLYAKNAVSQRDRDTAQTAYNGAKADYDAAQAQVTEAQIKLGYAYVVAPISGYTSKESWTEGNLITTSGGEGLLTEINQLDPIFIDFSVPSTEYQHMRQMYAEGRVRYDTIFSADIIFADGTRFPHKGEVTFIDTRVDVNTSVLKARAVFPNPDRIVLPGQFVRLDVHGAWLVNAMRIPQTALLQTQQGSLVITLDEKDLPQYRTVTISQGLNNDFIIESGLTPGERIISAGVNKIRPGQPVRIEAPTAQSQNAQPGTPQQNAEGKR